MRNKSKSEMEKELKKLRKERDDALFKGALLDALLKHVPDHVYFKDKESRFVKVSKSVAEQFGVESGDKLIGKTDFDYFTEEHARPAFEDEQKIIKTGTPIEGKIEKETHPDGRVTWVSTTKIPRYDEEENIVGILGISRDVTRQVELEEKIKEKLEELGEEVITKSRWLNALLENMPESLRIYFKDKESRFLAVSRSKAEGTGFSREEFVGKTDFDFFSEKEAKVMFEEEKEIMASGKPLVDKVQKIEFPDGKKKWFYVSKVPFYDVKGNVIGIFGISRDITGLKLSEIEKDKKLVAQREELMELSTPVIDVWDGVLTIPILGSLDSERASRISEELLTQIVEKRAYAAIIDISGITAVDSAITGHLIRTAKAVSLVGAEAILTGVGVEIAQTIADLGLDMEGLKTMSTLRDGLRYVINRRTKSL